MIGSFKELWQRCIRNKPWKMALILIGITIFLLLILLILILNFDQTANIINSNLGPLSVISGLIVLLFSVVGFVYNSASLSELRNEIVGTHQIFHSFNDHIEKLYRKVSYSGHGKLKNMTLVVSSIAYGIQSGDKKNTKSFYKILNKYLDDVEETINSTNEHKQLTLYIWEKESHISLFGLKNEPKGVKNERTNIVCNDLKKLLIRIKKNNKHPKFTLKVHSTKKLDWRLFLYEKDEENFGMSVLFTPLVDKQMLASGKWAMSSYSSNSSGIDKHLTHFLATLDQDGTQDITHEFLNIDKFISKWFEVTC